MKNVHAEMAHGRAFIAGLPSVVDYALIGSAQYMPDEAVNDVDFLVLVAAHNAVDYTAALLREGWESCGDYDSEAGKWDAVRRDSLNLVITTDADFYERFRRAMEVCKALRLADKSQRVAVCRIVRDGWAASVALPSAEPEVQF